MGVCFSGGVVADEQSNPLVSRSIGVLVILSGFLLELAAFDFQWTYLFVQNIFGYVPNVFAAPPALLVGNVGARFLSRVE